MMSFFKRGLVLVASVLSAGTAVAADLPVRNAPAFVGSIFTPGFYVIAGGGLVLPGTTNTQERDCATGFTLCGSVNPIGASNGWSVMGGVGYRFNPWFRGDIGLGHARVAASGSRGALPGELGAPSYSANFRTTVLMATGYVELAGLMPPRAFGIFEPFVGAGIGGAQINISDLTFSNTANPNTFFLPGGNSTNFAWKLTAGTGIRLAPQWRVDFAYAYYDLGRASTAAGPGTATPAFAGAFATSGFDFRARSHAIEAALRYDF